jgi:anthranilate synthase component I
MQIQRIQTSERIDPFYAYLDLVQSLGQGQAFLLDAAKDAPAMYRMSVIGVLPILRVSVKDEMVTLSGASSLLTYLQSDIQLHAERSGKQASSIQTEMSFYARDPLAFLEDLRKALRRLVGSATDPFARGFLGYFGYDAVHYLEQLPKTTVDDRELPDLRLEWHLVTMHLEDGGATLYNSMPALDRILDESEKVALRAQVRTVEQTVVRWKDAPPTESLLASYEAFTSRDFEAHEDILQTKFEHNVNRAKQYIRQGDIFQVVLSKRMRMSKRMHPYVAYERLRTVNPSPYMFMVEYDDLRLFGASPEVQFRSVGGVAEMKPIAGTSKGRGKTPEEDARLAEHLLQDEKERAEHVMLVDLCRNDLGRVCQTGTVQVDGLMTVEPYSHLFHLVSTVHGQLQPEVSVFHALLSTFPAGTLSGAPKIRAMEIIDELESLRRGPYGGMLGMVDFDANANLAIIIRTVVEVDDMYHIQVGAGIVADSDPTQEWLECGHKAGALMQVLTGNVLV